MKRRSPYFYAIVAGGLLAAITATLVVAAPAPLWRLLTGEPVRTGTDPLSAAEQEQARRLALQNDAVSAQVSGDRVEILRIERRQEPKAVRRQAVWPRRADLYAYNYQTDTLLHSVINLESGAIEQTETVQGVQLPLTEKEVALATQIALADPQAGRLIESAYRQITGQPLADPTGQLAVHALIFRAEAMPDQVTTQTAACGLHRCAQLILSTPEDALINVVPVVDLSRRQMVDLDTFVTE